MSTARKSFSLESKLGDREQVRPVCLPHPCVRLLGEPRTRRQFLTYAAALAAVAATPRVRGSNPPAGYAPNTLPYPRTYLNMVHYDSGIYLSTTNTNAGVPLSTVVAQSNGIAIGPFLAIEESGNLNETLESLFSGWKSAASTNGVTLKCFNYISPNAPTFNSAGGNWYPWYNNAVIFASMFAYTSASGSGTTDLLPYSGAPDQSYLQTCLTNAQTLSASYSQNGKTGVLAGASAWFLPAQYFVDVYYNGLATSKYGEANAPAANSEIDGFFQDNSAPVAPRTDSGIAATWNGVGTAPVLLTSSTQKQYQEGLAALFGAFRAAQCMLVLSNGANGAVYFANGDISALAPALETTVDLAFTEAAIGASFSLETFHNTTPGEWMTPMIQGENVLTEGGVIILHQVGGPGGAGGLTGNQSGWGSAQWQYCRFGIAAACMRNWWYALNCGVGAYNSVGLLDEEMQIVSGSKNWGWLSAGTQRLDPPQSVAWSNGVWRRRFPNGWVLWNPRGNGQQTVSVTNTLARIKHRTDGPGGTGWGDSSVNNGQTITGGSVTLNDADGLFLIGTG